MDIANGNDASGHEVDWRGRLPFCQETYWQRSSNFLDGRIQLYYLERINPMSTFAISPPTFEMPPATPGTPSWPITLLYSWQGQWSEEEDPSVQEKTRQIVELSEGQIEVLPMPIPLHQRIVAFLYLLLRACVDATGSGEVFLAAAGTPGRGQSRSGRRLSQAGPIPDPAINRKG